MRTLLVTAFFLFGLSCASPALASDPLPPTSVDATWMMSSFETNRQSLSSLQASSVSLSSLQASSVSLSSLDSLSWGAAGPSLLAATQPAPEPSTGLGLIIPGWIFTGLGLLNLVTLPVCFTDFYVDNDVRDICLGASAAVAGAGLAVGIPLLIVGYNKRKKHKQWEIRQGVSFFRHTLESARFVPVRGGGTASLHFQF